MTRILKELINLFLKINNLILQNLLIIIQLRKKYILINQVIN